MQYKSDSMVVLHACIHEPLVPSQPKPKIVSSATGSTEYGNPRFAGCIIRIIEVNTRCAASDVNPFKIRCNLQITKATG